jgi:hypothetical protein
VEVEVLLLDVVVLVVPVVLVVLVVESLLSLPPPPQPASSVAMPREPSEFKARRRVASGAGPFSIPCLLVADVRTVM